MTSVPTLIESMQRAPRDQRLSVITGVVRDAERHDKGLATALLATLESEGTLQAAADAGLLEPGSPWRATALGRWLSAKALELMGNTEAATSAWNELISAGSGALHEAFLSRARLRSRSGDVGGAFTDLRRASELVSGYPFLAQVAMTYVRLRRQGTPPGTRALRVALLSSTTADLFAPLLGLMCFREGIAAEVYTGPYGAFRQEILDAGSGLYRFAPDIVLVATNWRDANCPAFDNQPERHIDRVFGEIRGLWETLLARRSCRLILHNFDAPAIDSSGHLGGTLSGSRRQMLEAINHRLVREAPPAVTILDFDQIAGRYGKTAWSDASQWHVAKQHPVADALPVLAHHHAALIRSAVGLSRKVLVLDLDNTLWGGVIGEDGLEGIRVGPPSAAGEAYAALQTYALELKQRGILLAVCSKNNPDDARAPFLHHDGMVLTLDDFVVFRANWTDKPTNLREIASTLNLGIDSLVFLDDNPVERALVRRELPEIAVPEPEADPATLIAVLDAGRYFEALSVSAEDRARHQSYRENAKRDELRSSAASVDDFLRELSMQAEVGPFNTAVLGRVVQLFGKTNQFNLTTRRHDDEHVRRMMASRDHWTQYFKLRDRFGDNGIVGLMIARVSEGGSIWEIDSWLMSCRVIGRQMEELMLETLAHAALAANARALDGVYLPTAKNGLVADLFERMGFTEMNRKPGGVQYRLNLSAFVPRSRFIEVVPGDTPVGSK